jgi:hypothetical protein
VITKHPLPSEDAATVQAIRAQPRGVRTKFLAQKRALRSMPG